MTVDPIIREVRRIRREIEQECDGDSRKLLAHFLQVQRDSHRRPVTRSPKRLAGPPPSAAAT